MSYFSQRHDLYTRMNFREEQMTGLFCTGYNDFHTVKPSTSFTSRPFKTIHLIFAGKGTYFLNGRKYSLHGGQMFYTPANKPICYYPDESEPWRYMWFSFSSEAISQYLPLLQLSEEKPFSDMKDVETVEKLLEYAYEKSEGEYSSVFLFMSAFMQILALEAIPIASDEDEKKSYVRSIKKCIDSNYASLDFTVDSICNILHLSHSYICRIFKSSEGQTIINYIEGVRINRACDLLRQTEYSVSKISVLCGYRDSLHFMKSFKKKVGMTAIQYRNFKETLVFS